MDKTDNCSPNFQPLEFVTSEAASHLVIKCIRHPIPVILKNNAPTDKSLPIIPRRGTKQATVIEPILRYLSLFEYLIKLKHIFA